MLRHVVLLKLRSDVNREQVERMYESLRNLKNEIGGITSFSCGANVSREGKDHEYMGGFVIDFVDEKALYGYLSHPSHKRISEEQILPIVDDVLVFDYPFKP